LAYRDLVISNLNAGQQAQAAGQDPSQYIEAGTTAFDQSVAAIEDTIKFVPWEYDNYVFLASLNNIGGQAIDVKYYQAARDAGLRGVAVEPFGPAIRVELARAYQGLGDLDNALTQASTAAKMDPGFTDAWLLYSSVLEAKGDKTQAIAVLKQFQKANPTDASVASALARLEPSSTATPATTTP